MRATTRERRFGLTLAALSLVLLTLAPLAASAQADDESRSLLGWLFELIFAHDAPEPPRLAGGDLDAILKMELLLREHNRARPSAANHLLLGILASAKGDPALARDHFADASKLDNEAVLPLTMAAQTALQEGATVEGIKLHEVLVRRLERRAGVSPLALVTARLDLAVAYRQRSRELGRTREGQRAHQRALAEAGKATDRLNDARRARPRAEVAMLYLQAGTVWQRALGRKDTAVELWSIGARIVDELVDKLRRTAPPAGARERRRRQALERDLATLAVRLNLNLAQAQPAGAAAPYLARAEAARRALPKARDDRAQFLTAVQLKLQIGRAHERAILELTQRKRPVPAELRTRLRGVEKELDDEINAKNRFAESFQKAKPAEQSPLFRQTQRFRLRLKDDRLKASEPKTDDEVKRLRDEAQKIRRVLGSPRVLELHQIMEQNPDLWRKLDRLEPRGGPIRHP